MKRILVLKEHHGPRYFDVSTDEQLQAVCLSIITVRYGPGGDCESYCDPEPEPQPIGLTEMQFEALPDSNPVKIAAKRMRKAYEDNLRAWKQHNKLIEFIQRCIETKDGKLAHVIMQKRCHSEDEGFVVEEVETTYQ